MPIKLKYIQDGIGVEFISSGIVTGAQIIEANQELYKNENFTRKRFQIVDRTNCTKFKVSSEEIRVIAAQDIAAAKINPQVVVALISTTDLQYGMSRVYHAYVGDRGFLTEIFKDRKSADEWIRKQLTISNQSVSTKTQSI